MSTGPIVPATLDGWSLLHQAFRLRWIWPILLLVLGVGILANLAIDGEEDSDLKVRDASHLFPVHTTWVGFRRGVLLRGFMYEFLEMLAPHLTPRQVQAAETAETQEAIDQVFAATKIPFLR